jgi:L-ascorbate metabolism protein UlaG (beta-lactamase superfamily)
MLKIHHIRNATMVIETGSCVLLVDPMLSEKGTMPSYTTTRFNPQKNPIVELPEITIELLPKVTHALITHLHSDHLDKKGEEFLKESNIPVICSVKDADILKQRGLNVFETIEYNQRKDVLNFRIEGVPALHGYGQVSTLMGNVMGFYINFEDISVYLSSDTVYTEDVHNILSVYQPDISVLACGSAQLDEYEPILMTIEDILKFVKNSPGLAIANHLEAVNHCKTTRFELKKALEDHDLIHKIWIPNDGESKNF